MQGKHCVIIGGTGRVGSSAASVLLKTFPDMKVTVASRSPASYEAAVARRPDLKRAGFQQCSIEDPMSVEAAVKGADLVIHAAGPFQCQQNHVVLEKSILHGTPYIDICDDVRFSESSKADYHQRAIAAGVPAVISAGIYPGTSNVMAAHIISIARNEYDTTDADNWKYQSAPKGEEGVEPTLLRYSYYTAGSGGAGKTILETTFMLAGEEVLVYKEGQQFKLPALSNRREIDFGPGIGRKGTYLYNLPEVGSAHKYMGVPGCSARFGTEPFIWNWAMWLMARLLPRSLLSNRAFVKQLVALSDPFVRSMDKLVGEAVAMKVEVDMEQGKNAAGLFVHRELSTSVGYSVVAFAQAVLSGQTAPGVWYPEEKEALADRRAFLRFAATGTERFDLNRPSWSLESEITQLGGLIYW